MPPLILEMRYLTHSAAVPPLLRLRPKLGDDPGSPGYIFAEPGVGYRMQEGEKQEREAM